MNYTPSQKALLIAAVAWSLAWTAIFLADYLSH